MKRKNLKELGLSIKENYNKTHITMKKIIITLSLMCGIFAFGQEKEVKTIKDAVTPSETSLKPLVIIAGKEYSLKHLYELNEKVIEKVTILKPDEGRALYGYKGNNGVIVVNLKKGSERFVPKKIIYIVEGKKMSEDMVLAMEPNKIESINILKNEEAVKQYGEEAREGAIIIKLKKKQ